jgi:hypothetical protein
MRVDGRPSLINAVYSVTNVGYTAMGCGAI